MKTITSILTETFSDVFEKNGFPRHCGQVNPSDRPDICQFQCNGAFECAKIAHKAPVMIAKQIADDFVSDSRFSKVEAVAPGFVNIILSDDYLASWIRDISNDVNLGIPQTEPSRTIVVDYGGANVAKPLHIGHLRPAIIGQAAKNIASALGNKTIGDIHMGDWGLPIGQIITELSVRHPEWKCLNDDNWTEEDGVPELNVELLNEVYPYASARSKEDKEYLTKAQTATSQLQAGRKGYIAFWNEIMRVSKIDLKSNYDRLNVFFDLWYGESDADKLIPGMIGDLEDKGLLVESEGAKVVMLEEETDNSPMPPILIRKSNGSVGYPATDLATLVQRQRDFKPDSVWYVTDTRQALHFKQVFRCAKKGGIVPEETELFHMNNGTINGEDGKPFKTRDGGVMQLRKLLDTAAEASLSKLMESSYVASASDEEKRDIAEKVGIAAVKFGDLINHRAKDYIFDMDKFLSFEGKTGTYILYTVTRINSILRKASPEGIVTGVFSDAERDLMLKIVLAPESFVKSFNEKAPNYVCESSYQVAAAFSKFYHDVRILDESDSVKRDSWLALISLTRNVIQKHLDVLGIETVENM